VTAESKFKRIRDGVRGSDEFYTPSYAICPLLPYLLQQWRIWEPCCGDGHIVRVLKQAGHDVIATSQQDGTNFLYGGLFEMDCDAIVTNPPSASRIAFCDDVARAGSLLRSYFH
jgi:hypothetical protein